MMKAILTGALLPILIAGCATTEEPDTTGATHYWQSTASTKQYDADHQDCEQQTKVDADGSLDPNSTSFDAYRDCMIEQGYSLRSY